MRITRHEVDAGHVGGLFRWEVEHLDSAIEAAKRKVDRLYTLLRAGQTVALAGSVVAPDSAEVAQGLQLAARAGTGVFVFAQENALPRSFVLGEGLSVTYSQPIDESYVSLSTWQRAFYLAVIARQPDALAELCAVPTDLLRRSSTGLRDRQGMGYRMVDVLRAVGTGPDHFTHDPAFQEWEAFAVSGPGGSAPNINVRCISAPLLRVLQQLECKDAAGFAAALTEALQLHKEYYSSTEQLRKDFEGFVSPRLTAVAALAWDRGLHFRVESDYLPWSWVTGEVFRPTPAS